MPGHVRHMQRGSACHPVRRAFDQIVESQARVESVLLPAPRSFTTQVGRFFHRVLAGTRRTISHPDRGFSGAECQLNINPLAIYFFQYRSDPAAVLSANPVQLEPVRDEQRHPGQIVRDGCHQGPDPGVELLFRHLLCQLFHARLPQALARPVCCACCLLILGHVFLFLCGYSVFTGLGIVDCPEFIHKPPPSRPSGL